MDFKKEINSALDIIENNLLNHTKVEEALKVIIDVLYETTYDTLKNAPRSFDENAIVILQGKNCDIAVPDKLSVDAMLASYAEFPLDRDSYRQLQSIKEALIASYVERLEKFFDSAIQSSSEEIRIKDFHERLFKKSKPAESSTQ